MKLFNKIPLFTVYHNIFDDQVIKAMLELYHCEKAEVLPEIFGHFYYQLSMASESDVSFLADAWQNHLLNLILFADNPFTRAASKNPKQISPSLIDSALNDLKELQPFFFLPEEKVKAMLPSFPQWSQMIAPQKLPLIFIPETDGLNQLLFQLIDYYATHGVGIFSRYSALGWNSAQQSLVGIKNPDPIGLNQLIGYQNQREEIIQNTKALLSHLPANNVLLYGDRGTGKSSTVKAILNEYHYQGLRLVELTKADLTDLPQVIRLLACRPQSFIIFIDDLSFENFEPEYKSLKAILEGGIEKRPNNVLIYATSNRRHLISESFDDRQGEDIHIQDTMQEKISLSDRFGLTITFTAPDQKEYLTIVNGLAKYYHLNIGAAQLERQAIQWERHHSGRSGRVARQFIDYLRGVMNCD